MKPATSKTELTRVKSLKEKYPNHVPVVCRTGDNSQSMPGIPVVDKKFLANKKMKASELKQFIQKHAQTREGDVVDWDEINLFSQDWPLDPNAVMEELYKEYQTHDGHLHVRLRLVTKAGSAAPFQILRSARADDQECSANQVSANAAGEERTSVRRNIFHMPDHDPHVGQLKELPQYILRERSSKSELRALPPGIILTRAWYGNPDNRGQGQDVTAHVRRRLQEKRAVWASNEWGNPAPGVVKVLEIYTSKLTKADKKREVVARVLGNFPGHVAVRCRQEENPGLPQIDKKWLAPKNMKLQQLLGMIQKNATSTMGMVDWSKIRLFSRDLPLDPTADMDELYEEHKDEDGHLHIELHLQEETEFCEPAHGEEENASAMCSAAEKKMAQLEKLTALLEKEAAAAKEKAEETKSQHEADYQHILELLAAKEAAELVACNAEDKALRAEEAMEAIENKVQEEAMKAEVEAARAAVAIAKLEEVKSEAAQALAAAQAEREAALQEATMHAKRAKAEEEPRRNADCRACRMQEWAESSACEVAHLSEMAKRATEDLKEKSAACEELKVQMDQSVKALDAAQKQAWKAEKHACEGGKARRLVEDKAKQANDRVDATEQALLEARERIAALEEKVQVLLAEKATLSETAGDDDEDDDCGFVKV